MKLELKHLVPYLLYGLKCQYKWQGVDLIIRELSNPINVLCSPLTYQEYKPILHPLSEYCGKTIGKDAMSKLDCDLDVVYQIWDLDSGDISLNKISYKTYMVLCKNHVDFNRLIDAGLAIDINTL